MKLVFLGNTNTSAAQNMAGSAIKSHIDDTQHKLQLPSKNLIKSSRSTRSKIEHELAELCVMTKAEVAVIVESTVTKWNSTLESKIRKVV